MAGTSQKGDPSGSPACHRFISEADCVVEASAPLQAPACLGNSKPSLYSIENGLPSGFNAKTPTFVGFNRQARCFRF
jgi:hypothetical protein